MPQRFEIKRRDILRTAMGALFLAPILKLRESYAQQAMPKRLILYFSPDSAPPDFWPTEAGDGSFTLKTPMQSFAGLEEHMLFIRELNHTYKYDNHHVSGIAQVFTGEKLSDLTSMFANGPSIDQLVAPVIFGGTPRKSIHLQCDDGRTDSRHVICYSGANQPILGQQKPQQAFDDIFEGATFGGGTSGGTGGSGGSGTGTSGTAGTGTTPPDDESALEGQVDNQILNLSTEQLRVIQGFLGMEEKEKLERHIQSLIELQRQINAGMPTTPGGTGGSAGSATGSGGTGTIGAPVPPYMPMDCSEPEISGSFDLRSETNIANWIRVNTDIIVAALACDRTRVASLQLHFSGAHLPNFFKSKLSTVGDSWHDEVAHLSASNATSRSLFNEFHAFHAEHVAYLANQLNGIPEGDGTMLDNTLIMWGFEVGTDHNHNTKDMPYLLLGGRGFGIKSGQFLKNSASRDAQMMHTAVLQAFGVDAAGFGERPDCGPLPGILM